MLRAHSMLWHYLLLGPEVVQVCLAAFMLRRGLHRFYPAFFAYAVIEALTTFTLYACDLSPRVSAELWWRVSWAAMTIGGIVRFIVLVELFQSLLKSRPTLFETGKNLFYFAAAGLVLIASIFAAYTKPANPNWIVGYGLILQQTLYIIDCGLILFMFAFAAHFRLAWSRITFGICLGFSLVFCEHLASRSVIAAIAVPQRSDLLLVFLNMATYHVAVLIWCYYLLVPHKSAITSAAALPENNLAAWNRELERLLQQ